MGRDTGGEAGADRDTCTALHGNFHSRFLINVIYKVKQLGI